MSSIPTCGGGPGSGGPPGPTSGTTGVTGTVTNTRGGAAVSGATIAFSGTSTTAMTNAQGVYPLTPLIPGTYDITATATGMAASKLQSVVVTNGQTTTANLIMFSAFNSSMSVAAPTIAVTNGLSQGQTVSGQVSFTVAVTAANSVRRIDLRASNMNALAQVSAADAPTATFSLNTCALTNGPGFVDIIAYDLNQNSSELVVGFTVSNGVGGSAPSTPTGFTVTAVTTGQSLGLFRIQRAQRFSALGIRQDPNILTTGGRTIHLLTAPSTATLFVETAWKAVSGATGYTVFRSSGGGQFVQVAQVTSTFYDDADPSLAPGTAVSYEVKAFNPGGNSVATQPLSVTPLPAFNVKLMTPANNATGVPTTPPPAPTYMWTLPNGTVGTDQLYDISVQGVNDPFFAWYTTGFALKDTTTTSQCAPAPPPPATSICNVATLQSGKIYQWDIYEALGETIFSIDPNTNSPNSAALAVANGGGLVPGVPAGGSLDGPFTFTTTP